ncbi:50S ribosomal protein L18 [bacterium]|nr:50S ribosomal protein L18 [bacterium]
MKVKPIFGSERRKRRISLKIKSTGRGRKIVVFRSNRHILAQIVDIVSGKTLLTVFSKTIKPKGKKTKTEVAFLTGKKLAEEALKKGIKRVVFDRRGYKYHGRVKALAEGAREGGLKF